MSMVYMVPDTIQPDLIVIRCKDGKKTMRAMDIVEENYAEKNKDI